MYERRKLLEYSKNTGLNKHVARKYILKKLEKGNPSSVAHSVSIINFFFEIVLNSLPTNFGAAISATTKKNFSASGCIIILS